MGRSSVFAPCAKAGGGVDQFSAILGGGSSYFTTETCAYLINEKKQPEIIVFKVLLNLLCLF